MITAGQYLQSLEREYLSDYIPAGGAAIKFVATSDGNADSLRTELALVAQRRAFLVARIDAARVKVHMIDKVFNAVAEQIDWQELAGDAVRKAIRRLGFHETITGSFTIEHLALENNYDGGELRRELRQALQQEILQDFELTHEFRIAMLRLCEAVFDHSSLAQGERDLVLSWLCGRLQRISTLKQARIYQKIARHNARDMLTSLTHWIVKAGRAGLVMDLDIRQCAVAKRSDDNQMFYPKTAVLDTYELLRQLIDGIDDLKSCFVLVTMSPDSLSDPNRGIEHNYDALKYRIWDEVRDTQRSNPLAALVRTSDDSGMQC